MRKRGKGELVNPVTSMMPETLQRLPVVISFYLFFYPAFLKLDVQAHGYYMHWPAAVTVVARIYNKLIIRTN